MSNAPNRSGAARDHTALMSRAIASGQIHIMTGGTQTFKNCKQFTKIGVAPEKDYKVVGIDLDRPNTFLLLGVQGSGKSYTLQLLYESALLPSPTINQLPSPPCVVVFHYSSNRAYAPEVLKMVKANDDAEQIHKLREQWGAGPNRLTDVIHLCQERKVALRQSQNPDTVQVRPILAGIKELDFEDWLVLLGAVGEESDYLQTMYLILERCIDANTISIDEVRAGVEASRLSQADKDRASLRLDFLSQFIRDDAELTSLVKPGRLIVVDLRDITRQSAFRLIVVLMRIFGQATLPGGGLVPKILGLDEFHVYAQDDALVDELDRRVRMMRHDATSIIFASQDPCLVKPTIIELASVIGINRIISPRHIAWLGQFNEAIRELNISDLKRLMPGQGYWWTRDCSDPSLTETPFLVHFRPAYTKPTGSTKTATSQT